MNEETAKKSLDADTPEPTAMPDKNGRLAREYLGDGVYIQHDGWNLILTTENGIEVTNTIYLEPRVFDAFEQYVLLRRAEAQKGQS